MPVSFKPGSIVNLRNRDWVVMPGSDDTILNIKPLNGTEDEATAVYLPLEFPNEKPKSSVFPSPGVEDLGSYESAKMIYHASRLSFRNVSGPFRCFGKLSFRPHAFQLVPLIMALKQNVARLLVADDVGIGKTVEALLIAKEYLDRGKISRFAVVCPAHLCVQWRKEILEKFALEAEILTTSTVSQLERQISGDGSVFTHFPYLVISIDYIKQDQRREAFALNGPEFIIVDEVHTCANPAGRPGADQLRNLLVSRLSENTRRHMILLSATPHSGKTTEFQSVLSLLSKDYATLDIAAADDTTRDNAAKNILIRRRADVEKWYEDTPFPKRESHTVEYKLSNTYMEVHDILLGMLSKAVTVKQMDKRQERFWLFTALSLFRGVMSSPHAGLAMINKESGKIVDEGFEDEPIRYADNLTDQVATEDGDDPGNDLISFTDKSKSDSKFKEVKKLLEGNFKDTKFEAMLNQVKRMLDDGYNPIVFCKYIKTAEYIHAYLLKSLSDIKIACITGNDPGEERDRKIEEMENATGKKVLVSTDCLSEGRNLQKAFNAIIHYDLPWNPNRLEQREGRIDRYGQNSSVVKTVILVGTNNIVDSTIIKVLYNKTNQIRQETGISVPFPQDSQAIVDALLVALKQEAGKNRQYEQLTIDFPDEYEYLDKIIDEIDAAGEAQKLIQHVFSRPDIDVNQMAEFIHEIDEKTGNPADVEQFFQACMTGLGAQYTSKDKKSCYTIFTDNLDTSLKEALGNSLEAAITFASPVPEGYSYLGRNSDAIELLCRKILGGAVKENKFSNRAAVIVTVNVAVKTVLLLLRVRNIIRNVETGKEMVTEEMVVNGYRGQFSAGDLLSNEECLLLLDTARPTAPISNQAAEQRLEGELRSIKEGHKTMLKIVRERSQSLIEAHQRFSKVAGNEGFEVVEPVLPPDLLGVYILVPEVK